MNFSELIIITILSQIFTGPIIVLRNKNATQAGIDTGKDDKVTAPSSDVDSSNGGSKNQASAERGQIGKDPVVTHHERVDSQTKKEAIGMIV